MIAEPLRIVMLPVLVVTATEDGAGTVETEKQVIIVVYEL